MVLRRVTRKAVACLSRTRAGCFCGLGQLAVVIKPIFRLRRETRPLLRATIVIDNFPSLRDENIGPIIRTMHVVGHFNMSNGKHGDNP
jgi:hypothetical protein